MLEDSKIDHFLHLFTFPEYFAPPGDFVDARTNLLNHNCAPSVLNDIPPYVERFPSATRCLRIFHRPPTGSESWLCAGCSRVKIAA